MTASGCEVPAWILSLPKLRWKKHRPGREAISTQPDSDDDDEAEAGAEVEAEVEEEEEDGDGEEE